MSDESRTFPCENCGADLKFSIGVQSLQCEYCDSVKTIELTTTVAVVEQDFEAMLARLAELRTKGLAAELEKREITCRNCGGTIEFIGTLTSDECTYCGTPLQRDDVHQAADRVPVDGVLPFQVDRETARQNLKKWVKSRWFAPNEFLRRGVQGEFNGVYLPYWTYDALTQTQWEGQRGDNYTVVVGSGKNRRTEVRTRWSFRSGMFQQFFDDLIILAATNWPTKRLDALEPWPLDRCLPFDRAYLAGYLASTYDVALDAGFQIARTRMEEQLRVRVRREIGGDKQRISQMNVYYNAIKFKHLLLPVWTMVYRYHGKPYQVFINAGTGEVQGDRPWSWIKIVMTILLTIAVTIGGIFLYQKTQKPIFSNPPQVEYQMPF